MNQNISELRFPGQQAQKSKGTLVIVSSDLPYTYTRIFPQKLD